jgi:hypothetical protein
MSADARIESENPDSLGVWWSARDARRARFAPGFAQFRELGPVWSLVQCYIWGVGPGQIAARPKPGKRRRNRGL